MMLDPLGLELLYSWWKQNPGPLQEQQMLLTAENLSASGFSFEIFYEDFFFNKMCHTGTYIELLLFQKRREEEEGGGGGGVAGRGEGRG
jgi:hypothetical protein